MCKFGHKVSSYNLTWNCVRYVLILLVPFTFTTELLNISIFISAHLVIPGDVSFSCCMCNVLCVVYNSLGASCENVFLIAKPIGRHFY